MSDLPILHPSREAKREKRKKVESVTLTSTFEDFMSWFESDEELSTLRSMHSALWSTLPIERLMADGTWLLVSAVAQKYGLALQNRNDVRDVADRVNRLLDVGLLLCYGTAEAAAKAFVTKVAGGLTRAIGLGYRPGQTLSSDAWRAVMGGNDTLAKIELRGQKISAAGSHSAFWATPCYLFLADCFKAARALGDELKAGQAEYTVRNRVTRVTWTRLTQEESRHAVFQSEIDFTNTIDFLNPMSKSDWGRYNRSQIGYALQARAKLAKANLRLSVWLALPIEFVGVPRSMLFMRDREVGKMWITAQVMRAVGEKKIGELHAHYPAGSALKRIRLAGPAVLIDRVTAVALERGVRWSPDQLACFRLMIAEQLNGWLDWDADHREALEAAGLIRVTANQLQINPKLALLIVMGQAPEFEPIIKRLSYADAQNFFKREVLPRVDWSAVDITRLKLIITARLKYHVPVFDTKWIARRVPRMPKRYWAQAIDLLLNNGSIAVEAVPMLAKKGLITIDAEFFVKHRALISNHLLVGLLEREFSHPNGSPLEKIERLGVRNLALAFVDLPEDSVRRLWRQPLYQSALLEFVRILNNPEERLQLKIEENLFSKLTFEKIGQQLWQSYVARL